MAEAPAPDSLRLTVSFDPREKKAAQFAAARRGPLLRRPVAVTSTIVAAGVLLGVSPSLLRHVFHPALPVAARIVAGIFGVVVVALGIKRTVRQVEESQRHEHHPDAYTLSDAGLEISGEDDLALMSWSSMTRVHETKRFFLFVADSEVQYLPKRALDPAQAGLVRALIHRHAPAAGRPRLAPPGN